MTEIYYFSGTGNSLFIAKELNKRLPESKKIPIVQSIQNKSTETGSGRDWPCVSDLCHNVSR